jgi:SAM-dependent methyltransferase
MSEPIETTSADSVAFPRQRETVATQMPRVSANWLALREAADAAARSADLVALARRHLAGAARITIHDLGCGTGSMGRWLAPQLPGRQHWIFYDRDPDLLARAAADLPERSGDGAPVTVETRECDITRLTAADLARRGTHPGADHGEPAGLVTASALLDLLTADEVARIAAACVGAGYPALLTISVVGRVDLTPADPLDAQIGAAFNAHQRRAVGGRRLLGPDAVDATVEAFSRLGAATVVRHSPWRLGGGHAALVADWFAGWLGAACEQRPELAGPAAAYARRRRTETAAGQLGVVVHHRDLFAHCD